MIERAMYPPDKLIQTVGNNMKKNVLFVMSSLRHGGAERSLINLLQVFDYDKYEVDLLLFQKEGGFLELVPPQVHMIEGGVELSCLYATKRKEQLSIKHPILSAEHFLFTFISRKRTASLEGSRQYRWVNYYQKRIPPLKKRYDIAISYLQVEQLYYLVDKVTAGRKLAWIHTDYSKVNTDREIDLAYLSRVDGVVSISDECVNILKELFPPIADKCYMLPNISSSKVIWELSAAFYPEEYSKDGVLTLISIGRIAKQKHFDLAIQTAAELKKRGVKFRWYVLGDGSLRNELEQMIVKLDVKDCFAFIGLRSNPYPYIRYADILVQTSLYEGKSVVLDEAKILCTPIVSTNYATVRDQVSDHEGIVVEMTGAAIADGIQQMAEDKERYAAYLSEHEYDNTACIKDYEALIDGTV